MKYPDWHRYRNTTISSALTEPSEDSFDNKQLRISVLKIHNSYSFNLLNITRLQFIISKKLLFLIKSNRAQKLLYDRITKMPTPVIQLPPVCIMVQGQKQCIIILM